ncbi:winged helix-turn-helix domain-containing protein [Agrococcus carbonis]|uniref:DNA-binding response regulator, OmpR family, contains REC and winged-helix (WHTH) domain n=1 Tax=Agrococcus carbonis TaxID=684552 RepID=A0A1H1R679_9MICO|nr:winged helix-turn-helix domain-containing protein [Agrococcus carbonis]SDS31213.1 DNA-binding response regulator, OmpR family, contains REC and winged-helix (wHTH) domain [Agrococcus carbonis]
MAHVVIFTRRDRGVLPALELLEHRVTALPATAESVARAPGGDLLIVDAVGELAAAKAICRLLDGDAAPVLLVLGEGGFAAVTPEWGVTDIVLDAAGPAEVEARIRLALAAARAEAPAATSGLTIDEASYQAKVDGRPVDLTYKEFELLRFLFAHPARVFTREQLLSEVWGYDYFGGTRTVDVHVRRLRAKLGDLETLIGTVRGVGYRFELLDE